MEIFEDSNLRYMFSLKRDLVCNPLTWITELSFIFGGTLILLLYVWLKLIHGKTFKCELSDDSKLFLLLREKWLKYKWLP